MGLSITIIVLIFAFIGVAIMISDWREQIQKETNEETQSFYDFGDKYE